MKELPTLPLRTARAGSRRLPRIAACGLIFASACVGQSSDRSSDSIAEADLELAQIQRGKALANRCAICHLEPDPSLLPKQSWSIILGDMGLLLGIEDQAYFESQPGFARVSEKRRDVHRHFGLLPPPNLISATEWIDLKRYYLAT